MVLTFYDSLVLFKNYNILILYDYRYYCDFKILFNILIPEITRMSVFGIHVRIRTSYVIIRTPYIPLDKLYIIDESIRKITITLFIINFMNNLFQLN